MTGTEVALTAVAVCGLCCPITTVGASASKGIRSATGNRDFISERDGILSRFEIERRMHEGNRNPDPQRADSVDVTVPIPPSHTDSL